jgi:hypothetical protein
LCLGATISQPGFCSGLLFFFFRSAPFRPRTFYYRFHLPSYLLSDRLVTMFRFAIAVHFLSKNNQRASKIRQNKTPKPYSTVSFAPPPIKLFPSHLYHFAYYSVSTSFYTDSDREARDSLIFFNREEAQGGSAKRDRSSGKLARHGRSYGITHGNSHAHKEAHVRKQVRVDQAKIQTTTEATYETSIAPPSPPSSNPPESSADPSASESSSTETGEARLLPLSRRPGGASNSPMRCVKLS